MSDADHEWRAKLQRVSLVIETDFSQEEVHEAQSKYGAAARALLARGFSHNEIVKKYPALTLLVLVGHASVGYEEGRYWEGFWQELGLAPNQDFERVLRHSIA